MSSAFRHSKQSVVGQSNAIGAPSLSTVQPGTPFSGARNSYIDSAINVLEVDGPVVGFGGDGGMRGYPYKSYNSKEPSNKTRNELVRKSLRETQEKEKSAAQPAPEIVQNNK